MIGTSSDQQHLDRELRRCFFDTRRLWRTSRGLCIARLQCLLSSGHIQRLVHCHLYCWAMHMSIHMTCLKFKRFPSDSHFMFFFCKFCMSINVLFGPKRLSGSTAPILTLRLSENFLDHTSSRLTLPVLEEISRYFGGWLYSEWTVRSVTLSYPFLTQTAYISYVPMSILATGAARFILT
jgi:hypothetical protein